MTKIEISPKFFITPEFDLLFNQDETAFYFYDTGAWKLLPRGDRKTGLLARIVANFLRDVFPEINITTNKILEIIDTIERDIPTRYSQNDYLLSRFIAFSDITLDIENFSTIPHNRANFAFHYYNFPFPSSSPITPVFDAYLARTFTEKKMHQLIYEMMAYYLLPKTDEPAAFFLYGEARTGKTRMIELLKDLVGRQFVSALSLQSLTTDQFAIAELAGKKLNVRDEDESKFIMADKFKALISNADMEACRKYEQKFMMKPITKFLLSANQFPKIQNVDGGLKRRLHFIEFKNQIPIGEQDKQLQAKLTGELPGIIFKTLVSAKTFLANNQEFSFTDEMQQTKNEFLCDAKPVYRFLADACVIGEHWSENSSLYALYRTWCENNGNKPTNSHNFYKEIITYPGVESRRTMDKREKNIAIKSNEVFF